MQNYRHSVYPLEVVLGIVEVIGYRLRPENNYFGNSAGADCNFPIAQDICCTGLSGRNSFVEFERLHKVLSVNVPITHINCLGIHFPNAPTPVSQKNCFHIIFKALLQNPGFRRVSEGVSEGVSRRTLQNPFKTPSRTL